MIKSMTGFGRGEIDTEMGRFTVETKSVNSRTCTVIVRLPETLSSLESRVISYIKSRTSRGQINVSVNLSRNEAASGKRAIVDRELAKEYCRQLAEMKSFLSLAEPININTIAALPGVINVEEPEENIDEAWSVVSRVLTMAVDQLIEVRTTEGAAMMEDLSSRLKSMSELIEQISTRSPVVVEEYRERLLQRISDLLQKHITIDESRIATEVAIMADRCDINEEIVRLRSHICQISDVLKNTEGPVGRHLDFILQEVNREVNTIASKASDAQISTNCIRLKDETEKMREQAQNIE